MFLPRVLEFFGTQHLKRARDSKTRIVRHDHIVKKTTVRGNEGVSETGTVFLCEFVNSFGVARLIAEDYLNRTAAAGADTGAPAIFPVACPVDGGTATYNLTIQAATASTYALNAAPTGAQADDKCGTLSMTNTGVKGVVSANAGITWQTCW